MNNTIDNNTGDCIGSNLPPRAMRYTMESKNNLRKKGSLYVGLGEQRTTTINVGTISGVQGDGQTNDIEITPTDYSIYKTGVIDPPSEKGTYILVCDVTDSGVQMGWVQFTTGADFADGTTIKDISNTNN